MNNMKGLAITNKGIEDISALEINELVNSKSKTEETVCIFDIKKLEDLALLCYKGQSFIKILYLIDNFKFKNLKEINEKINEKEIKEFIKNKRFKVNCKRIGNHKFNSVYIEKLISEKIKGKIDFDNPEVIVYAYVYENNLYLGIDFAGFDLSKRDYRIFLHPAALKGTIAYALLRTANYKSEELLVDSFSGSGTICIEAAFFASEFPLNYYRKDKFSFNNYLKFDFNEIDKKINENKLNITGYDHLLRHVKAAQKNAKIAGVDKKIKFSRIDIEWLDTKFEKNSIDKIITHPPAISKINEKNMQKLYREFFNQAKYVLKKNGLIVLITNKTDLIKKIAKEYKFKLKKEQEVWQGQQCLNVVVFCK